MFVSAHNQMWIFSKIIFSYSDVKVYFFFLLSRRGGTGSIKPEQICWLYINRIAWKLETWCWTNLTFSGEFLSRVRLEQLHEQEPSTASNLLQASLVVQKVQCVPAMPPQWLRASSPITFGLVVNGRGLGRRGEPRGGQETIHGAKMKCFALGCKLWSQKWVPQNLQVQAVAARIAVLY